ncbi:MAG: hypothetical protein QOG10_3107 [Kribbellaceae bacterium]|nr:hypothetical protein [Kribbellaceae bacterium]
MLGPLADGQMVEGLALPHPPQVDYRLTATGRGLADTGVYLLTALDWNEVLEQDGTAQDTGQ